jgi:hypothetical protein
MPYFPQRKSFGGCGLEIDTARAKSGSAFPVQRQGSENARRFEMPSGCHISNRCLKYFHKLFTFGRGAEPFLNNRSALCR